IQGGHYFVDGVPLHQTPFAKDPEHPRTSSHIATLLGNTSDIETPDVSSPADLQKFADALDPDTLPAGGVDFFNALLAQKIDRARSASSGPVFHTRRPALFVCGSDSAWFAGRGEECSKHGISLCVMPRALFGRELNEEVLGRWAASAVNALREGG